VETAGLQGKFWEMHDLVFEHQEELDDASLLQYAREL
jgi:protein-disulfide isomerase